MSNKLVRLKDGNDAVYAEGVPYSTNEVRIGTWIDGKPIYRKTYYIANLQDGWTDIDDRSCETLVHAYGKLNVAGWQIAVPSYESDTGFVLLSVRSYGTSFSYRVGTNWALQSILLATFEYTKTTD